MENVEKAVEPREKEKEWKEKGNRKVGRDHGLLRRRVLRGPSGQETKEKGDTSLLHERGKALSCRRKEYDLCAGSNKNRM
ncbi:hypothetical protein V1477_011218 [Vespula maculifrons]|uniref:Uncharacterized protein n=1 Tax=Vespula maculifrons TaxID=7453 RepID=A0ABD2C4X8_VESMC